MNLNNLKIAEKSNFSDQECLETCFICNQLKQYSIAYKELEGVFVCLGCIIFEIYKDLGKMKKYKVTFKEVISYKIEICSCCKEDAEETAIQAVNEAWPPTSCETLSQEIVEIEDITEDFLK